MTYSENDSHQNFQNDSDMNCPSLDEWRRIIADINSESDQEYSLHLEQCSRCQESIKNLTDKTRQQFNSIVSKIDGIPVFNTGQSLPAGLVPADRWIIGGSGVVIKAWDVENKQFVAVKMLIQWLRDSAINVRRIMNEAEAIGRLNHRNIIKLHKTYADFHPPAIVMEWVEGKTLARRLEDYEPTIRETIDLITEITGAMCHAHEHGILHRDIKPSNILLSGNGFNGSKVCDFGLAKFSRSSGIWSTATEFVGTPVFMAPEAFRNESGEIGPWTDVYSIGAVLYRLLTGKTPFDGSNPIDLGIQVLSKTVTPPSQIRREIPRDLESVCLKCLMKDPEERYRDMASLESDLKRIQKGQSISIFADNHFRRIRRWAKRDPRSAYQAFAFVGLLLFMVVGLATLLQISIQSEKRALLNQDIANQRLTESVEAMSLASPLIKELLSNGNPNKKSIEKIIQFATLRQSIGVEPEDLTDRLRFHYVMLETADALRKIDGYREKARTLAEAARSKIGSMLSQERASMANIIVYQNAKQKFTFTLLERAEIQYAHSCALLFYCIDESYRKNTQSKQDKSSLQLHYLQEAIHHANIALGYNPQLDEARGDIANYQVTIAEYHQSRGELTIAEDYLQKALKASEHLIEQYPNNEHRWEYYIQQTHMLSLLRLQSENGVMRYQELLKTLDNKFENLKNDKIEGWEKICVNILGRIDSEYRIQWVIGNKNQALNNINKSIQRYHDLPVTDSIKNIVSSAELDLMIERLCLYALIDMESESLLAEHNRINSLISSLSEERLKKSYQSQMYLFTPLKQLRNYTKAEELLSQVRPTAPNIEHYRQLCRVMAKPKNDICMSTSSHMSHYENSINKTQDKQLISIEIERLLNLGEYVSAKEHLLLLKHWIEEDKLTSLFILLKFRELTEMAQELIKVTDLKL